MIPGELSRRYKCMPPAYDCTRSPALSVTGTLEAPPTSYVLCRITDALSHTRCVTCAVPPSPRAQPLSGESTVVGLTAAIEGRVWAWTAAGAAATYLVGHQHGARPRLAPLLPPQLSPAAAPRTLSPLPPHPPAHRIGMPGLRGHRFGLVLSVPMLFIGWSAGLREAFLRHEGYLPNGRPARFPAYKSDRVPYFVKRAWSTRPHPSSLPPPPPRCLLLLLLTRLCPIRPLSPLWRSCRTQTGCRPRRPARASSRRGTPRRARCSEEAPPPACLRRRQGRTQH